MRRKSIHLILFLLVLWNGYAQENPQEDYLNANPVQENFDKNHWEQVKKTMLREARGNAKAKGDDFKAQDYEGNTQEASYYDYQEESFEGEYAKNNGEDLADDDYENYASSGGYESLEHDEKKGSYFSKEKKQNKASRRARRNRNPAVNVEGLGTFGSILLYALLAVFLGYVIYVLFINTSLTDKGKAIKTETLERAPVEIPTSELEKMLEKALKEKDYRLAIRIYFIFILKELSSKKWITWKKEKTNSAYLSEMRKRKQYNLFNDSVTIFELAWYGDYEIKQADYSAVEPKLKQLLKELESH